MKSLSLADLRRLNDAVLTLYSELWKGDFESAMHGALDRLIPTEVGLWGLIDGHTGMMSGGLTPEVANPVDVAAIFNRLSHQHPAIGKRTEEAQSISQHLSRSEWHRRDLFAELFRPFAMEDDLGLEVNLGDQHALFVGRIRTRRNFTREDRMLLTLMIPHLRAAWQQSQAVGKGSLPRSCRQELEPGMVEISARGRVIATGSCSNNLLRKYTGEEVVGGKLPGEVHAWVRTQMKMSLPQPHEVIGSEGRLTIRYLEDSGSNRRFLLLKEKRWVPDTTNSVKLGVLGISRREQEVLFWVAQGKTNQDVARLLGISAGTVKRHLENIYATIGVENRHAATLCALRCLERTQR